MPGIERIVDRQVRRWEIERAAQRAAPGLDAETASAGRIVTVSRQHGAGGTRLASLLADRLGFSLLHRDVIDRICASSGQSRRIVELLDGHARSQLQLWFESVLRGQTVDTSDYVKALLAVIFSLSELGGVVVVGRGANVILGPDRGFHLRVVGPREDRIRRLGIERSLGRRDALRELERLDRERAEWVRRALGGSIDDPLGYDLVINTRSWDPETTSTWLADAAREKFERVRLVRAAERHARA